MFDREDQQQREVWARRSKSIAAVLFSFAILIGAGLFVGTKATSAFTSMMAAEDYQGEGKDPVIVTIPSGASVAEIGSVLLEKDVVQSEKAWDRAAGQNDEARNIQAGRYRLKTQLPATEALAMLMDKNNLAVMKFTVPEGLRLTEQVDLLVKATGRKKKDFEAALKNPDKIGLPKYAQGNAEGMLFPDTYTVDDDATAAEILQTMVKQYVKVTDGLDFKSKSAKLDLSRREVLTVASIIEAEVKRDEDRSKVARVLYNRLDQNMRLQLDTTVMYANNKRHGATTSDAERANNSPYNTYQHDGLPPGPISAPGKAAIEAAANPAKGKWLYFVAVDLDSGKTEFARTSSEHEKNVKKFQQWCSDNKGKC